MTDTKICIICLQEKTTMEFPLRNKMSRRNDCKNVTTKNTIEAACNIKMNIDSKLDFLFMII